MRRRHDVRGWALAIALVALAMATGAMLALADTADHPLPQLGSEAAVAGPQTAPYSVATVPYTTLVDIQAAAAQTLDPHWLYDANSARVVAQVYETLLTRRHGDPEMLVPHLATGWEATADAKTFTFSIRSNVTFHQGGSLEPHDVAYSVWRGMIQDRADGPMWMWFDLLSDKGWSIEDLPGDDLAKCQAVKEAVTYDDAAGTVTFHLARPAAVFLAVLETPSASVLDQEWMAANGGWAGCCADWRDYHDPAVDPSLLYDRANGTGPFRLSHWTTGEVRLERHENYWRRPATLEAVVIQYQASWPARRDMLTAGQADLVQVPVTGVVDLDPYVWGVYQGLWDTEPTLVNPGGTLRLFRDLPGAVMYSGLFCHGIEPADNPYIGSGALDGNGIPPGFFADLHVRQALNYAFDWPALIQSAYTGEAQRARGPIPEGLMGYTDAQPVRVYSPTLSAQAFQLALGGEVWSQGFSMTVAYNEGNLERQAFAEMLAQGVEAINPNFHVRVVGMPWSDLLAARQSRLLPVYLGGWGEDYHHPHNWVHPFLYSTGAYGGTKTLRRPWRTASTARWRSARCSPI